MLLVEIINAGTKNVSMRITTKNLIKSKPFKNQSSKKKLKKKDEKSKS